MARKCWPHDENIRTYVSSDQDQLGTWYICDRIWEKNPLRTELRFQLWSQIVAHAQYKSQISNARISAMEAARDTKQSAIGSSWAVLNAVWLTKNWRCAPSGPFSQILSHIVQQNCNSVTITWVPHLMIVVQLSTNVLFVLFPQSFRP